jgi:hypothetical protein
MKRSPAERKNTATIGVTRMNQPVSYSQNGQDRFVAEMVFAGKRNGFFVEAGAGDGLWISNTLLLEQKYGWTGILIEPTSAFAKLQQNRPYCRCDDSCLASTERVVTVVEIFDRGQAGISANAGQNLLLSRTMDAPPQVLKDMNSYWGEAKAQYQKSAQPLAAVLEKHRAPKLIDYLSLDVEGFEYDILRTFPFDLYKFLCLGVERPPRELVELLAWNGYKPITKLGEDVFFTRSAKFTL